jgi:phospholipid transport system transporter-binding protein
MEKKGNAELRIDGGVAFLEGDLTLAHATRMLAQGKAAIQQGVTGFDLSRVEHLDSSAISLILGLRRFAASSGKNIQIQSASDSLLSLAKLYGVAEHL